MSYTLRGRLETRLAATLLPFVVACVLASAVPAWWPIELAALMLAVGLSLDALVYDRLLDYQPGWLALPFGLLELGLVMALVRALPVDAPLAPALAFFGAAWLVVQLFGHAAFPLLRLSYAEDSGELGRLGAAASLTILVTLAAAGGIAWATLPPTVHLSAGVHRGPIVVTRRENLVGEPGAVVRGGLVVRASHVTIRNLTVVGGENGIDVEDAHDVVLDRVSVVGATMDGIHVRRAQVAITDCAIDSPGGYTQGIDISFSADLGMSMVEGCTVVGGQEGIVIDSASAMVRGNHVNSTSLRAISINEMAMGMVERNQVAGALGIGIFCSDRSMCEIEDNTVSGTRPDVASGATSRNGYGIVAHYGATAELSGNHAGRTAAFANAQLQEK